MRTPKRDFEIFSLSAIDLFCSAMGAFIVICIVLFPFYRKVSTPAEIEKLQQTITQQNQQLAKMQQLQQTVDQLKQALENSVQMAVLGVSTKKNSFVMVVDLSGSMKEYREIMTKTCGILLDSMQDRHQLQIIGYHTPNDAPQLYGMPKSGLMPMTAANKAAARQFIDQAMGKLAGTTPTEEALEQALESSAECIFLLTDGAPTSSAFPEPASTAAYRQYLQQIADKVTQRNGGKKEIHCIAIGDYDSVPDLVDFLSMIAKRNQGQFLGQSK